MTLHKNIIKQAGQLLAQNATNDIAQLNTTLRLLSKWRSVLIQNTLIQNEGTIVLQGPLKGMNFISRSAEGCHIAKLLGCYEQPLQPYIEAAIARNYTTLLNIGCAEGYYAVGLARRMSDTKSYAFDLDENAQASCKALAEKNNMQDRIEIGSLFKPENFKDYEHRDTLVFCDIEGAEKELLDPELAPALKHMDIIVESHECLLPGITTLLLDRFKASHEITLVEDNGQRQLDDMPGWFKSLAHLDQLLAVWEWRSGPTPWLIMKHRA